MPERCGVFLKRSKHTTLRWRHNGRDGVSNHQPHDGLLNPLFRRRSKKISKLCVTGLCVGNSPVNAPQKWPVTRKMFPFHDVIMILWQMSTGRQPVGFCVVDEFLIRNSLYIVFYLTRHSNTLCVILLWPYSMPSLKMHIKRKLH